ncbi:MAG: endo-1,4-beta-xylanase, partial [Phormidium sp.]
MSKNLTKRGRRNFLFGLGALAGAGVWALADVFKQPMKNKWQSLVAQSRDFTVKGNAPLKERAAAKGLIYGAAAWQQYLAKDTGYAKSFAQECAILVPEGNLKWADLRPTPDRFDFTRGDWLLKFTRKHNMLFRGHTLLWHYSNPPWFNEVVNRQNAEKMLVEHIETVVKHYAGKIHSWDVVNEAIRIADGRADGLRKLPWLELLGLDYIDLAFRAAAKADPKALLVYNDNGLEYDNPDSDAKRAAILRLLAGLKSKGTPIDVFGIQ